MSSARPQQLEEMDYPISYDGLGLSSGGRRWPRDIFPYVKSSQVFVCPSANSPAANASDVTVGNGISQGPRYGMNNDFGTASSTPFPVKMAAINRPAELILLIDTREGVTSWDPYLTQYTTPNTDARHFDGAVIAYADGHAKWQKQEVYSKQPSEANYDRVSPLWRKQFQAP